MFQAIRLFNGFVLFFSVAFLFGFVCHSLPTFRPLLALSLLILIVIVCVFAFEDSGRANYYYRGNLLGLWILKGVLAAIFWLFTCWIGWWLYVPDIVGDARRDAIRQQQLEQQQAEDLAP